MDVSGLIFAMQDLGDKARWLRKRETSNRWKDKSKCCAYNEDFGHNTEDYIAPRKEIIYLLRKGDLKLILGRRNKDPGKISRIIEDPGKHRIPSL